MLLELGKSSGSDGLLPTTSSFNVPLLRVVESRKIGVAEGGIEG